MNAQLQRVFTSLDVLGFRMKQNYIQESFSLCADCVCEGIQLKCKRSLYTDPTFELRKKFFHKDCNQG